jgi:hypothetical protein
MENANSHNKNIEESRAPMFQRKARAIASTEEKVERKRRLSPTLRAG